MRPKNDAAGQPPTKTARPAYGTDDQLRVFAAKVQVPITPRLIRGAKHAPHLEAKDETLALITDFITDLQRGFLT